MSSAPIHSLRVPETFQAMETSPEGLSTAEAISRRGLYGENILSEQAREIPWQKALRQAVPSKPLKNCAVCCHAMPTLCVLGRRRTSRPVMWSLVTC